MIAGKRERVASVLGARPLRALPTWSGVLVLNYHRVGDPSDSDGDRSLWSATADGFDAQLRYLARNADVVGPPDLDEVLSSRRGRHVMLTFDDGYRDNHAVAYPLLRAHGLRATFFLATGFLDRPHAAWWDELAWMARHAATPPADPEAAARALTDSYKALPSGEAERFLDRVADETGAGRRPSALAESEWMTWDMARELRDGGMWLGGHTVSHPVLSSLDPPAQEREIAGCAERLEAELGQPMAWFSYPVGSRTAFTAETKRLLAARGVRAAFSFYGGHQPAGRWDRMDVPRANVSPRCDARMLAAMLAFPQILAGASA